MYLQRNILPAIVCSGAYRLKGKHLLIDLFFETLSPVLGRRRQNYTLSNRVSLLLVSLDDFVLWVLFFVHTRTTDSIVKFFCNLLFSCSEAHRYVHLSLNDLKR